MDKRLIILIVFTITTVLCVNAALDCNEIGDPCGSNSNGKCATECVNPTTTPKPTTATTPDAAAPPAAPAATTAPPPLPTAPPTAASATAPPPTAATTVKRKRRATAQQCSPECEQTQICQWKCEEEKNGSNRIMFSLHIFLLALTTTLFVVN